MGKMGSGRSPLGDDGAVSGVHMETMGQWLKWAVGGVHWETMRQMCTKKPPSYALIVCSYILAI